MKMSDVFKLPIEYQGVQFGDQNGNYVGCDSYDQAKATAHAINCHDELVEALDSIIQSTKDNTGHEPSLSVFQRDITEAEELLAKIKG